MGSIQPWHILLLLLVLAIVVAVAVTLITVSSSKKRAPGATQGGGSQVGVAPGWYPAPDNPALVRWFDGQQWTDQTQPRV